MSSDEHVIRYAHPALILVREKLVRVKIDVVGEDGLGDTHLSSTYGGSGLPTAP